MGYENSGRKKGTPNKKTQQFIEEARAGGIMPLDYMLSILRDETLEREVRLDAAKAAAPYVHAKLSATVVTGGLNLSLEQLVMQSMVELEGPAVTRKTEGNGHLAIPDLRSQ